MQRKFWILYVPLLLNQMQGVCGQQVLCLIRMLFVKRVLQPRRY